MVKKKKVYTVATAHLDTVWSWDFETTVSKYIYDTLVDNFALFKKYPNYTFSFEGSYRYELMEEYYPELFEELKEYVKQGRWNVCGSSFENGDVNCPSPEALFRNILFGNSYFDEKFGKRSVDIYLPDCFGFGWALPSIAHHAHLMGFTTQKLAWGSAYGTPFDIGKWQGVDGNYIYASCNPHDYYFTLTKLRDWDFVLNKLKENEKYGLDWTYLFHGIGDRGGAPEEKSVKFVEDEIAKNDGSDIEVVAASADQIYHDIDEKLPAEVKEKLPVWKTELVMQNHGVGGYTSRAIGKRWNAKCQDLADIAERAGVEASYYNTADYNEYVLEKAWKRAIAHQFHDDTPGTSVQRVYKRSWNDYAMSINQFAGEIENYTGSFSTLLKSDFCVGIPVSVYNSLEFDRHGVVKIQLKNFGKPYVRVFDNNGKEVKSQVVSIKNDITEILFVADVKSLGTRVYDVRPSDIPCPVKSSVSVNGNSLENEKYIVTLNKNGDISSIIDKADNERELLDKPIIFGLFNYTGSKPWPAWEMNFKEANKEPDRNPILSSLEITESGPARVAVKVKQTDKKSEFVNYITLEDGGETVNIYSEIEWRSMRTLCKNRFAFTAENPNATFDLGLGAIQRGNMSEKLFEVPAQRWADITDNSGEFGVSVISECKHGWDKFSNNTLRLTAVHTPKYSYRIDSMQAMMDLGLNRYSFALFSHKGDVGAETQMRSREFVTPFVANVIEKHSGTLGSDFSFGSVSTNDVIIRAVKRTHHNVENQEVIVRLNEGSNKFVNDFELSLGEGIENAKELYASEEYLADATVKDGKLVTSFKPYEIKTFSLKLKTPSAVGNKPQCSFVNLEFNNENKALPKELLPKTVNIAGVAFETGNGGLVSGNGKEIVVQTDCNKLKLLCAGLTGEKSTFVVDGEKIVKTVNFADKPFAGWDLYDFEETAFVKHGHLGFEATHSLNDDGSVAYAKGLYYWVITLDVHKGSKIVLPNDNKIIVLAATEVNCANTSLVTPLEEQVEKREFDFEMNFKEKMWRLNSKLLWNLCDKDDFIAHNNNGKNGKRVEQRGKHFKTRTVETVGH